jgi:hypothetical protein
VILAYLTRFKQICNHPSHYSGDGQYVPKDSAKFLRLQELCAPLAEAGEKVLVFTQFREMCGPLADAARGAASGGPAWCSTAARRSAPERDGRRVPA